MRRLVMSISRDTKIEDIEFVPTPSGEGKSRRFHNILGGLTYGELLDLIKERGGVQYISSSIGPKRAAILEAFIAKNPPVEDIAPVTSMMNSFCITTPSMSSEDKIRAATAGVDAHLIEVVVDQFKKGAVVIEP